MFKEALHQIRDYIQLGLNRVVKRVHYLIQKAA